MLKGEKKRFQIWGQFYREQTKQAVTSKQNKQWRHGMSIWEYGGICWLFGQKMVKISNFRQICEFYPFRPQYCILPLSDPTKCILVLLLETEISLIFPVSIYTANWINREKSKMTVEIKTKYFLRKRTLVPMYLLMQYCNIFWRFEIARM